MTRERSAKLTPGTMVEESHGISLSGSKNLEKKYFNIRRETIRESLSLSW